MAQVYGMYDPFVVVALHVPAVVPGRLHVAMTWLATDFAREGRERLPTYGVYHVPDVVQRKAALLLVGVSHPLVLGRKSLEIDVLVSLMVDRLPHFLEKATGFVLHENYVVDILAWFHLRVDQLLVVRSSLLGVAIVLLYQNLPSLVFVHTPFRFMAAYLLEVVTSEASF